MDWSPLAGACGQEITIAVWAFSQKVLKLKKEADF
jgi:hypothetical protein